MKQLQGRGVSAILDYAAEDDVGGGDNSTSHAGPKGTPTVKSNMRGKDKKDAVARVYDYESEIQCDRCVYGFGSPVGSSNPYRPSIVIDIVAFPLRCRHVETFLKAVDTASGLPGEGFAAVKLTALGNPLLIERISGAICVIRGLFAQFDTDGK
jgi:proline dehydrogenase